MNFPGYQIPEMNLGKFPDSTEFQSCTVNFKFEVCSKTANLQLTMQWIKEMDIAKSIDDLITTRSIVGRSDFPDYEMLDAKMASALSKLFDRHTHSQMKDVGEQRAQNDDRFSRGRQIAFMIYDQFVPVSY